MILVFVLRELLVHDSFLSSLLSQERQQTLPYVSFLQGMDHLQDFEELTDAASCPWPAKTSPGALARQHVANELERRHVHESLRPSGPPTADVTQSV